MLADLHTEITHGEEVRPIKIVNDSMVNIVLFTSKKEVLRVLYSLIRMTTFVIKLLSNLTFYMTVKVSLFLLFSKTSTVD